MDPLAVLAAAIAAYAVGAAWYSPYLFGKPWRRLAGVSAETFGGSWMPMAYGFLLELLRAWVMSMVVAAMGAFSLATGIEAGFWVWLGFVATVGLGQVVYEKRSFALFAIGYGYHLVALVVVGAILATW